MVLEAIYVCRHGYRSNWVVDSTTGSYSSMIRTPTGIAADPALASYGVDQANRLAEEIQRLEPPPDLLYSSPFYRCLQTLEPAAKALFERGKGEGVVRVENGLGEWYGTAHFTHPSPAPYDTLTTHFPSLLPSPRPPYPHPAPLLVPSSNGESIPTLHARVAYALSRIIAAADADPAQPKALLLCTHAATMIASGRVLTGRRPERWDEEDFRVGTCALSVFKRRGGEREVGEEKGNSEKLEEVGWEGVGVGGGWDCVRNGDCGFLSGGEERTWFFSNDESFLKNPNTYNDTLNAHFKPAGGEASSLKSEDDDKPDDKPSRL
ncbi:histidine phosphatase superfamily [Lineolata rhizophorae]|uniref:Histidine phosphatase superfamily n=1 Tax=Lineolata rhizophorae TaxID=578093 RepID=A0A6A6PEG8_9PEZI|nr:histidine phosphatase superfamily [Lineolata rhizophorae]